MGIKHPGRAAVGRFYAVPKGLHVAAPLLQGLLKCLIMLTLAGFDQRRPMRGLPIMSSHGAVARFIHLRLKRACRPIWVGGFMSQSTPARVVVLASLLAIASCNNDYGCGNCGPFTPPEVSVGL